MSVSYQFSHEHNLSSVLYGASVAASRLWALLRTLLLLALGVGVMACVFAVVVAFWWPLVQVAGCLALVAAFAYVTFPRSAKPARCPYCKGRDIDAKLGRAECRDCGKTWSY